MESRALVGGPLDGRCVPARRVAGSHAWITDAGRCYAAPGPARFLYMVDGAELRFAGHGARRCENCGAILEPDESTGAAAAVCRLCAAPL